jgi:hypothetical protein
MDYTNRRRNLPSMTYLTHLRSSETCFAPFDAPRSSQAKNAHRSEHKARQWGSQTQLILDWLQALNQGLQRYGPVLKYQTLLR